MQQLDALKPRVAKLAALNAKYNMTAMYHTYSGNHDFRDLSCEHLDTENAHQP
jgi:hypothetical protein